MEETAYRNAYETAAVNLQSAVQNIPQRLIRKAEGFSDRMQTSKGDPLKKLRFLYEFMDEIYAHAMDYTACSKGCHHCCSYNIVVTELEVQFIEQSTGIKRSGKPLENPDFLGNPCIFLEDGICTIYAARPFSCRRRIAMTASPDWCKPEAVKKHELPMLHFQEIERSFDLLVLHSQLVASADIREFFEKPEKKV